MERIILKTVSKNFPVDVKRPKTVIGFFLQLFTPQQTPHAFLKKISLNISTGEIVGVIGPNGSGKSTLLRIISGIYQPTSGSIITHGKLVSLISLRLGFRDRLTVWDNIQLLSSIFGVPLNSTTSMKTIMEFADIKSSLQTKLFQLSPGMLHRLAFSIAVQSNADIFLFDELFETSDAAFRKKITTKINQLRRKGTTIVVVSHERSLIESVCTRVIVLQSGMITHNTTVSRALKHYLL